MCQNKSTLPVLPLCQGTVNRERGEGAVAALCLTFSPRKAHYPRPGPWARRCAPPSVPPPGRWWWGPWCGWWRSRPEPPPGFRTWSPRWTLRLRPRLWAGTENHIVSPPGAQLSIPCPCSLTKGACFQRQSIGEERSLGTFALVLKGGKGAPIWKQSQQEGFFFFFFFSYESDKSFGSWRLSLF